ncbi:MAG TPA: cysteine hydrolase family protein [Pseudolabrys sp.]|nr:cysteine hydrolase family protein [Pseudolabrys sp.]
MSEAKTLLQMAGVKQAPANLSDAAVVIIDAQNEYVSGRLPLAGVNTALARLADLLAAARAAGAPIIHVAQRGRPGGLFDPESPNFQFAAQAAPHSGEPVVEKPLPNAFAKTDLDAKLQAIGKKTLVIAGFMTHMCVSATIRSALDHGYHVTVASDAVATRDLPDPLGGPDLSAEQINRAALAELADRFAAVAPVRDIKAR